MLNDFKYRFSRFMQGRYGVDSLSRFLSGVLLAVIILGLFIRIPFSGLITLALLVILYWRMFSRNISKRYEENQKFLQLRDKFLGRFSNISSNLSQFKDYHIYKCPRCNQKIRIPRGKGRAAAMSSIKKADKRQPGDRLFFLASEMYDHV